MSAPYYSDEYVTLYHGDCRDVLAGMDAQSVAAVMTDPPYSERTHSQAKTNKGAGHGVRAVEFESLSEEDLRALLVEAGRVSQSWVIASLDYRHAVLMDIDPPTGLRMLRVGVWVKPNPMPQIRLGAEKTRTSRRPFAHTCSSGMGSAVGAAATAPTTRAC